VDIEDIRFYCMFSPPKEGESLEVYARRRAEAWTDCLIPFKEADIKTFKELALEIHAEHFASLKQPREKKSSAKPSLMEQRFLEAKAKPIHFAGDFDQHVFHGAKRDKEKDRPDSKCTRHVGFHSFYYVNAGSHKTLKKGTEIRKEAEDSTTGAYRATVTIYKEPKGSNFFPDNWRPELIRELVQEAYLYYRVYPRNQYMCSWVTWAGMANVQLGRGNSQVIWIGGLGDGESKKTGIKTAWPALNGSLAIPDEDND
jgi:hypothetical protein